MTNHENPKQNIIDERFQFNMCNRKMGESVSQYMAELRRLSQYCKYGASLDSVKRLFSVWDKPWSHATKVVKWGSKLILTKIHGHFTISKICDKTSSGDPQSVS